MSKVIIHNTFTLERTYAATVTRVFRAFSDPTKKRRWFAEGDGFIIEHYELDFRHEGYERTRFRFGAEGPLMTNDCVYLDIVPDERIVFAYKMTIAGAPLSSSMGSIEFVPEGGGTRLRLTEHTAYLDGQDGSEGRRVGTAELLEALGHELEAH